MPILIGALRDRSVVVAVVVVTAVAQELSIRAGRVALAMPNLQTLAANALRSGPFSSIVDSRAFDGFDVS